MYTPNNSNRFDVSDKGILIKENSASIFVIDGMQEALENYDTDAINDRIVGAFDLKPNSKHKSMEVDSIFARNGFGALTYLVAMEISKPKYLITTRTSQITDEAKNVWKNFVDGKGSNMVNMRKLDENNDKEPYLNIALTSKRLDLSTMKNNTHNILKWDDHSEMETQLQGESESLLMNAMRRIYR